MATNVECGEDAARHFAFAPGYRNLNHGSYGTYPVEVRDVLRDYQAQVEARPDAFVRYKYRTTLLDQSRAAVAEYLKVPVDTCVLLPNTSTGIDTILHNMVWKDGDVVICFNTIYTSYAYTLDYLSKTTPLQVKAIEYTLPVSDGVICGLFEDAVAQVRTRGQNPRLAIIDTINSLPGVRMPFEALTKQCRKHDILSLVDGAHGAGQIPLDLIGLDPDFFLSNLHKWLYVPRGCAVMYVPERRQPLLKVTLPTGFYYGKSFVANFSSVGTLDDTPYLCIQAALAWRERVSWEGKTGDLAIMGYMSTLARTGGAAVARILGTKVLENKDGTLGNTAITNVRLPLTIDDIPRCEARPIEEIGDWIMRTTTVEHDIAVNVFAYDRALWVRLCAQIYLTLEDFETAGKVILHLCKHVQNGEWRAMSPGAA